MKLKHLLLASALSAILPGGSFALAAETAHDHATGAEAIQLELNQGKKWNTDAPLRKGMAAILSAMNGQLENIHNDTLTESEYQSLAKTVNDQVQYMFRHCELEPAADEQLHVLLARIMEATNDMQARNEGRVGAKKVVQALNAYSEHFHHEGWRGLKH